MLSPTVTSKASKAARDKNSALASNKSPAPPSAKGSKDGDTTAALKTSRPSTVS
jgi:hypothetical protein